MSEINDENKRKQNSEFVYYYNRERRLENASDAVKKSWENGYLPKNRGFIKGLLGTPGSRSIFVTIVILSVLVVALTLINSNEHTFKNNKLNTTLKAFLYDETVYVSLTCTAMESITEPLKIEFQSIDEDNQIVSVIEVTEYWKEKKIIARIPFVDYSINRVKASFDFEENNIVLIATVDRP